MTAVRGLMRRPSTIIAEDPDHAGEFDGVYEFVLGGDQDWAHASKLESLDEMVGDRK